MERSEEGLTCSRWRKFSNGLQAFQAEEGDLLSPEAPWCPTALNPDGLFLREGPAFSVTEPSDAPRGRATSQVLNKGEGHSGARSGRRHHGVGAPGSESSRPDQRAEWEGRRKRSSKLSSAWFHALLSSGNQNRLPFYPATPGWGAAVRKHLTRSHLFHFALLFFLLVTLKLIRATAAPHLIRQSSIILSGP